MSNVNGPSQRNTNIEILRFLLMCFIFFWHILVHGYNLQDIGCKGFVTPANMPVKLLLETLFVPATYCFIFISGYYGMKFSVPRLIKILLYCIITSVVCRCFLSGPITLDHFKNTFPQALLPITNRTWWFMNNYILIFILSGILERGIKELPRSSFRAILIILFTYMFLAGSSMSLICLLIIYLTGQYFRQNQIVLSRKSSILLFGGAALILFALLISTYTLYPNRYNFHLLYYNNPLIVIMAIALFFIALSFKPWHNHTLNTILSANLFVYLFTESFRGKLYLPIADIFKQNFIAGLGISIAVISVAIIAGFIIKRICDKTVESLTGVCMKPRWYRIIQSRKAVILYLIILFIWWLINNTSTFF